ncbi:MAG: helix-turn-helix domain-containing protein [Tepidisphaerales bacterium]
MRSLLEDHRFDLLHGPYQSPQVRLGDTLLCKRYGDVRVYKFSDGRIPWPMCRPAGRGAAAFVLCEDLERAVCLEVAGAVARAWGVCRHTVAHWRSVLGVEQFNAGTQHLFREYLGNEFTSEEAACGRRSLTPERSAECGRRQSEEGRTNKRQWTKEEDALLGTTFDRDLARRLERTTQNIRSRRQQLGVPVFMSRWRVAAEHTAVTVGRTRFSPAKMRERRLELSLFQTQVADRCGWKVSTVYWRLESGCQLYATPNVLARVAEALQCRVEDLLES